MGADLLMVNFKTPTNIDRSTVLSVDEFRAKATELVQSVPLSAFDGWIEDYHYGLGDDIPVEDEMPEDPAERAEIEAEARRLLVDAMTGDYEVLRDAVFGSFRFIDWTNIGGVTVWFAGGTSFGDVPFDGWDEMRAAVCLHEYIDGADALIPWVLSGAGNYQSFADTETPQAVGLVSSHTRSILVHALTTHPDPAVRAELVAEKHLTLTVDDLTALADDPDEQVRAAASRRLVEMTA